MTTSPRTNKVRFAFFGTGPIARIVLAELLAADLTPALVVTAPDAKQGRGMHLAPSPVATIAADRGIETLKPQKIDAGLLSRLAGDRWDVFVVADYGFILPKALLDIPKRGTVNMHPSLLPRLRGPSPIRSAILNDEQETGVTIMLLDEQMDHGPIIAQKKVHPLAWPPAATALEEQLARTGGTLLAEMLPHWVAGAIEAREQNHDLATYTRKFEKADGELDLSADGHRNFLKMRALEGWPGTFAFFERGGKRIRVSIVDAHVENGAFVIDTVKPEGKNQMPYQDFLRSGAKPIHPDRNASSA